MLLKKHQRSTTNPSQLGGKEKASAQTLSFKLKEKQTSIPKRSLFISLLSATKKLRPAFCILLLHHVRGFAYVLFLPPVDDVSLRNSNIAIIRLNAKTFILSCFFLLRNRKGCYDHKTMFCDVKIYAIPIDNQEINYFFNSFFRSLLCLILIAGSK